MDPNAKAIWRRVPRAMGAGVIRAADADVLRCDREAVSRYEPAARHLHPDRPLDPA
jgi:hypothetical protein